MFSVIISLKMIINHCFPHQQKLCGNLHSYWDTKSGEVNQLENHKDDKSLYLVLKD